LTDPEAIQRFQDLYDQYHRRVRAYAVSRAGRGLADEVVSAPGQPASTQFAINRIVNGQAYYYIKGRTDRLRWYRDTNPSGHPSMKIPDPRALLGALNPSVQFHVARYQVIGGMRLEELRASNPGRLPALNALPGAIPGARVTELNVWVDEHNVVRRMSVQQRETAAVTSIYFEHRPDGTFEVLVPSKADLKKAMADFSKLRHG
jgi:hypothetical protein